MVDKQLHKIIYLNLLIPAEIESFRAGTGT